MLLLLTRPVYADFKRKRNGYGVIFDSHTGEPVGLAVIRLKNPQGLPVSTVVADKYGRYRLVAPKGEFLLEVSRPGYSFPSIAASKTKINPFFDDVLNVGRFRVNDFGTITKNIPVDSAHNLKGLKGPPWYHLRINLGKNTQYVLGILGTVAAIFIAMVQPYSVFPPVMLGIYLSIMIVRLFSFKPPKPAYGTVRDAATSQPIPHAVVRLIDRRFNKVLETQVTSPKGRYAFVVNKGDFMLMIEKKGYKKVILGFPTIKHDGFLMARDVAMKAVEKRG